MSDRTPFERAIVSDKRQAQSASLTSWQLHPTTITLACLLFGAAFGAGIRQTEYPIVGWIAFLALAVLLSSKMRGFFEALRDHIESNQQYEAAYHARGEELHAMCIGYDRILAESGGKTILNRTLAAENTKLRREVAGLQATVAGQSRQIAAYRDMLQLDRDARPAEVYTGPTERLEEAA